MSLALCGRRCSRTGSCERQAGRATVALLTHVVFCWLCTLIMSAEPESIQLLKSLLRATLRISVADGRLFIGTFVGTDKAMNVLLVNTDEFRLGVDENPDGRFVGQILVPWELVKKVEAQGDATGSDGLDGKGNGLYI